MTEGVTVMSDGGRQLLREWVSDVVSYGYDMIEAATVIGKEDVSYRDRQQ